MKKSEFVIEILEKHWEDECDAAGTANVEDIVEGEIQYESAEGGSYIDLGEVLVTLAAAATFVKNTIDIYKTLKKDSNKSPNYQELRIEMKRKDLELHEIDDNTKDEVYKDICENLEKDNINNTKDDLD
ncbi:MAG: hypothetical protein AAFQ80_23195 [Cyanobacteria bacterium J06621_8]